MERTTASDNLARPTRVSVVIPTHNRRELVLGAVESVLAQTVQDFELVVVDDGSTDGTRELLEGLDPRLRYEWQENRGASAARNAALRASSAPVVAFLDSDDRWRPNHLDVVLSHFERYPQAVLVSTAPLVSPHSPSFLRRRTNTEARLADPLPDTLFANPWGQMSCFGARREALVAIGGFDERIRVAEDADLVARLSLRGAFVLVRSGTVSYGVTPGSLTRRPGIRDEYLHMLTTSAATIATEIEGSREAWGGELVSAARAAVTYVAALRALYDGNEAELRRQLQEACRLFPRLPNDPALALMRPIRIAMLEGAWLNRNLAPLAMLARCWPDPRRPTPLTLRWWLVASAFERHRLREALGEAFTRPMLPLRPRVALRFVRRYRAFRRVVRRAQAGASAVRTGAPR